MELNQTMMPLSKYHSWSLLDPKPICYFDPKSDTHLVVWNGVYMTRSQALMIASEKYLGIWATPTMKIRAWKEFNKAYYSGAFGHRNWDHILEKISTASGHYSFLTRALGNHLATMKNYTGAEVLSWFNLHKDTKNES